MRIALLASPSLPASTVLLSVAVAIGGCTGVDDSLLGGPGPTPGMDGGGIARDSGGMTPADGGSPSDDAGAPGDVDAGGLEICAGTVCAPTARCCGSAECGMCVERGTSCPDILCAADAGKPPPLPDAGPPPPPPIDAGPPSVCGGDTCLPGFVCCGNATCGNCIPFGIGCMPPRCADAGPGAHCGGLFDRPCGAYEYCDMPTCGSTGMCRPRPETCGGVSMPVCGCDRRTYDNTCFAHRGGSVVAFIGACDLGDCRDMGCPTGQTCMNCGFGYTCRITGDGCF